MEDKGELAPAWRFILALAIVLGTVSIGFVLIYTWYLVIPVLLVTLVAVLVVRAVLHR